jgi:hypothetical protein
LSPATNSPTPRVSRASILPHQLTVRLTAIHLLNEIIDREDYGDDSIFTVVVENLLRNTTSESKNDALLASLNLLIKIAQYEAAPAQLRVVEGPDRNSVLMDQRDMLILSTLLRLLPFLFEGTQPK